MNFDLYKNNVYNDIADLLEELIEDDDIAYLMDLFSLIEPFIKVAKEIDIDYLMSLDFSNRSVFQIEDAVRLITLFLRERYPEKAISFENLCREKNKVFFISKDEQIAINNFCLEFLLSLLEKNSIESTKQIIKDNLHNSNIRALNISLEYILRIFEEFEKKYNHDLEESIKKKYLLSLATDQETFQTLFEGPQNIYKEDGTILILDTKDIKSVVGLLHEFIHEDNVVDIIKNSSPNHDLFNEEQINYEYDSAKYLTELPSITIEGEFLDWLLKNNYITDVDYNYRKVIRIDDAFKDIDCFISLKKLFDIIVNQGFVTEEQIVKNLKCPPEDIFFNGDYEEINNFVTYFIAFFIGNAYNELQEKNPQKYDQKIMQFHKLLSFKDFKELLKIIDIDLTDENCIQNLIDNFRSHTSNYLSIIKRKN